jgi:hypothetical protein
LFNLSHISPLFSPGVLSIRSYWIRVALSSGVSALNPIGCTDEGERSCAIMKCNDQDRQCVVMLSAAKHLSALRERCFAALSMTGPMCLLKIIIAPDRNVSWHPKRDESRNYALIQKLFYTPITRENEHIHSIKETN